MTDNAETHVAGILTRAYESAIAADRDYVVLIGDLMLDIWLEGQVDRQSREDPDVPVFFNRGQESSIGAAALVYAHLKTMGMPAVKFITAAANDGPFSFAAKRLNDLETAPTLFASPSRMVQRPRQNCGRSISTRNRGSGSTLRISAQSRRMPRMLFLLLCATI